MLLLSFLREQRAELFQLERTLGIRIDRVPVDSTAVANQQIEHQHRPKHEQPRLKDQMVALPGEFLQVQMQA